MNCKEEKIQPRDYPRVRTLSVDTPDSSGVTVHGEIFYTTGKDETEFGFVWDKEENATLEDGDKIVLGSSTDPLRFSFKIISGIPSGETIYVKAYATGNGFTVYGNVIAFKSKGGSVPDLLDFNPKFGLPLDTITITGENFSTDNLAMTIKFGDQQAYWFSESSSSLKTVVPDNLPTSPIPIILEYDGNSLQSTDYFTQLVPKITGLSTQTATFGEIIEIRGINFHRFPARNEVFFDSVNAKVEGGTQELLRVEVPKELFHTPNTIKVKIENAEGISPQSFTLLPPQITSFSPQEGKVGESILIQGSYFNPLLAGNRVSLGTNILEIISATSTHLEAKIVDDWFPERTNRITISVSGQVVETSADFMIKNHWVTNGKVLTADSLESRSSAMAFTINGTGYMGLGDGKVQNANRSQEYKDLYRYISTTNTWFRLADYPGTGTRSAKTFEIGNEAFVVGGRNTYGSQVLDVFAYEVNSDSWRAVSAFPGRGLLSCFGLGNKGYALANWGINEPDLWEYDPQTDTWTALSITPFSERYHTIGFALTYNGKAYVLSHNTRSQTPNKLWEFDLTTASWTELASMPQKADFPAAFVLDGSIYLFNTSLNVNFQSFSYKYDLSSDTWTDVTNYTTPEVIASAIFTVDGKAYLMGGLVRKNNSNFWTDLMWEFKINP